MDSSDFKRGRSVTNRMLLNDPRLGMRPTDSRGWTGVQRQIAEHTAPGAEYRVLMDNFELDSATPGTVTDKNGIALSISLRAGVVYLIECVGFTARAGVDDTQFLLSFSGTKSLRSGYAHYQTPAGTETIVHNRSPDSSTAIQLRSNGATALFSFKIAGRMLVGSTAGELTMKFGQLNAGADGNNAILFPGTYLKAQPIINLSDRSNP